MPKRIWIRVEKEHTELDFLALAVDKDGNEITHDRATSPHAALGMIMHTLARGHQSFVVMGFDWFGSEYYNEEG